MINTNNCQGYGQSHTCEFSHTKYVYENGKGRTVTHKVPVVCPE